MMSLAIHSQFDLDHDATNASRIDEAAASFASLVAIEAPCIRDWRAKECGNAGKAARSTKRLPTQPYRIDFSSF
jgi:hypothetical protein